MTTQPFIRPSRRAWRIVAGGMALVLLLSGCGGSDEEAVAAADTAEASATAVPEPAEPTAEPEPTATEVPPTPTPTPDPTATPVPATPEPTPTPLPPTPGEAEVTGEPLGLASESIGSHAPAITGHDLLTGEPIAWGGDTPGPSAVLFAPLQDWCPHCNTHVEEIAGYLSTNAPPEGRNVLVVTQTGQPSSLFPQEDWLVERGWNLPTVLGREVELSSAFGVTSVPTWILLDSDGNVVEFLDGHHVSAAQVFERIAALS